MNVTLRDVTSADWPALFAQLSDPEGARMAAFGTRDAGVDAYRARMETSLAAGTVLKVIVTDGEVVGSVAVFSMGGERHVTYGVARAHWGRGIASAALGELLRVVPERPLHASAAKDNVRSLRVLEKHGFVVCGSEKAFASARGEEVEEVFLALGA
jgi:RimJ/RimL family protein N-acetyltransferase